MPFIRLYRAYWHATRGKHHLVLTTIVLQVLAQGVLFLEPLLIARAINALQLADTRGFFLYLVSTMLVVLFFWVFHLPSRRIERSLAYQASIRQNEEIFSGAMHLPLQWHIDHHSGSVISRAKKANSALEGFASQQFRYIEFVIQFVGAFLVFFYFTPLYAFLGLVMMAVIAVPLYMIDVRMVAAWREENELSHKSDTTFVDNLANSITVITLRTTESAIRSLQQRNRAIWRPYRQAVALNEYKWTMAGIGAHFVYLLVLIPYGLQMISGGEAILVGMFIALTQYAEKFTNTLFQFVDLYNEVLQYDADVASVEQIMQDIEHNDQTYTLQPEFSWQECTLSLDYAIEDYRLQIPEFGFTHGEKIALIGPSGGGKSTFLRCLRGLYDAEYAGHFDDQPENFQRKLASISTLIPQDPEVFATTIEENITLGTDITPEQIQTAAELAQFQQVIDDLPHGLETDMRERGVNLSGGQKQRLALTRGLIAAENSDIVLFDEVTSSIDPQTESQIMSNIFEHFRNQTLMMTLHRYASLPLFDTVYEVIDGRLIRLTPDQIDDKIEWQSTHSSLQ